MLQNTNKRTTTLSLREKKDIDRRESNPTGKFLAKYNKFSSDMNPPPLKEYVTC